MKVEGKRNREDGVGKEHAALRNVQFHPPLFNRTLFLPIFHLFSPPSLPILYTSFFFLSFYLSFYLSFLPSFFCLFSFLFHLFTKNYIYLNIYISVIFHPFSLRLFDRKKMHAHCYAHTNYARLFQFWSAPKFLFFPPYWLRNRPFLFTWWDKICKEGKKKSFLL